MDRPIHDLSFYASLGAKQSGRQQASQKDSKDNMGAAECSRLNHLDFLVRFVLHDICQHISAGRYRETNTLQLVVIPAKGRIHFA